MSNTIDINLKSCDVNFVPDYIEHLTSLQAAEARGISLYTLDLELYEGILDNRINYRECLRMCISKTEDPVYWYDKMKERISDIQDDIHTLEAKCIGLGGKAIPHHLR